MSPSNDHHSNPGDAYGVDQKIGSNFGKGRRRKGGRFATNLKDYYTNQRDSIKKAEYYVRIVGILR